MDRRFVGIGVIVVALLAMAILPGLVGRSVPGTAVVDPAVPVVGGCVLVPKGVRPAFDGGTGAGDAVRVPRAAPGDCGQPDAGRVVAVALNSSLPGSQDIGELNAASSRFCPTPSTVARRQFGATYQWRGDGARIDFEAALRLDVALVAAQPGDAAGPWLACVAASDNGPIAADLTQRSSWDPLASCLNAADLVFYRTAESVIDPVPLAESCALPHSAQLLGSWTNIAGTPAPSSYRLACREFAVHVTGMVDPTAGGQLEVDWAQSQGACVLATIDPTRTLDGSLYGIGDAALPWTR